MELIGIGTHWFSWVRVDDTLILLDEFNIPDNVWPLRIFFFFLASEDIFCMSFLILNTKDMANFKKGWNIQIFGIGG